MIGEEIYQSRDQSEYSFITHRKLFLTNFFLFPKQKLQRNSFSFEPISNQGAHSKASHLTKANSQLMPFIQFNSNVLQGQQPAVLESCHFQIYKVVCKYRRCPCKFPFDTQIKLANDEWLFLYINHTKAMIPSACHQERPYLS